jgi:hypothetical protein
MGVRLAAGLCALAACGFNAGTRTGSDASDAPSIDAPAGDGPLIDAPALIDAPMAIDAPPPPPPCMGAGTMDTFTGATPCAPWATYDETRASVVQNGGALRITPTSASNGTHGGCFARALSPFGPEGVLVSVDDALEGATSYTALSAYVAAGTPSAISVRNGVISAFNPTSGAVSGSAAYVPAAMKWWRLRPIGNGIRAEVSADALNWTILGTVVGPAPTQIRIDIGAGTGGQEMAAGTAVFDNLDVCP